MARLVAYLLVALLGAGSAFALASCGEDDAKLLPGGTAAEISENLDSVERLVDEGECADAEGAALEVSAQVESLQGIDAKLKRALEEGADRLNEVVSDCEEETLETSEESVPTTTESVPDEPRRKKPSKEGKGESGDDDEDDGEESESPEPGGPQQEPGLPPQAKGEAKGHEEREEAEEAPSGGIGPGAEAGGEEDSMAPGTLSGRYEIGDRLGSGGMSNVYMATDLTLERTVAVKVLAEHLSDDERFVARFRREALAVAKLIHPNIVQVYDTGVDDGRHYIVMEYVEGRSGAQILQRQGPLDAGTAAEAGAQACAGLDYAHRRGIIHRDVKPGNLMIVGGPVGGGEMTVKLTDFGIARAAEQTRITQVGSVVGTAAYLAPEQVRGEEATPATDVYALGVVLYQFLTGRLPYEGSTLAELAVRQQNERPLPPSAYNAEVPETLGAAVLRALEGDPSRRYASADELAGGLQRGLHGEDVTLPLDEGAAKTGVLGDEAATRRLDETRRTEFRPAPSQTRRPTARAPRAPRPSPPVPPAAAKPRRGAFSRFVRLVLALVALVLIAAVVATVVIVSTDKATGVRATEIAGDTVDKVVDEFKDTLSRNTE